MLHILEHSSQVHDSDVVIPLGGNNRRLLRRYIWASRTTTRPCYCNGAVCSTMYAQNERIDQDTRGGFGARDFNFIDENRTSFRVSFVLLFWDNGFSWISHHWTFSYFRPVTAGVLRGERSRFQLFGDTVNTAARMESNGQPGRIHMSQDTATLLEKAGKGYWLEKRTDVVQAKGKGEMQTYWLANTQGDRNVGDLANDSLSSFDTERPIRKFVGNEELLRLIQWNVQRFTMLLREIETKRNDDCTSTTVGTSSAHLEEAKEGIPISRKEQSGTACASHDDVKLHSNVVRQLEEYITLVAGMYEPHAFHK